MTGVTSCPLFGGRRMTSIMLGAMCLMTLAACGSEEQEAKTVTVERTVETQAPPQDDRPQREPQPEAPKAFTSYTATLYSTEVPEGWTLEEDERDHSGFVRSRWRDPSDPNTAILIDAVKGETTAPASKAASVRASTSQTGGYVEVSFGPTTIAGRSAHKWVFRVSGDQRVDYFINECDIGIAVLGSTSPSRFEAFTNTFERVADALEPNCEDRGPEPTPSGEDCDPSYPDFCIPPPPPELNCQGVEGRDFTVRGDDPHRFDRDDDGVGCEE